MISLAACDKHVTITEATAHADTANDMSVEVHLESPQENAFSGGGYIHLFRCEVTADERFVPVEEISATLIKTSLTETDTKWLLTRFDRSQMCAQLYDGSRIATEVRSNTVRLAARRPRSG